MAYANSHPLIVFGAFDRHNLGDMLFAHVVGRLVHHAQPQRTLTFAGLASRDLREYGGNDVAALHSLARQWRDERIDLIHAGGEVLTCDAWEAAVMLQPPGDAQARIARHGARAQDRAEWARATLHTHALAPYVIGRETFPNAASIVFNAVGGASLDSRDAEFRAEVLGKLRASDSVSVRDARTRTILHAAGIETRLAPDPATLVAALFDDRIQQHASRSPVLDMQRAWPNGYLAVQISADFGDDATLADIARQLNATGRGIALFRAGAAPWHDDIDVYARLARHLRDARIFTSLNVWDSCALIAKSAGYAGSSLHGRIVAMAYALPRVNLQHPDDAARTGKQSAYAATWEPRGVPGAVPVGRLAEALNAAQAFDRAMLGQHANTLSATCRASLAPLFDALS